MQFEKLRNLNSFLRQRANDSPGLDKGDANKVLNYETIDYVAFRDTNTFEKLPKESFAIKNSLMSQLDFPFNPPMLTFVQFKLDDNFHEDENFKFLNMLLHDFLGQSEEKIWSLKNIIKLISILKDALFEERLR